MIKVLIVDDSALMRKCLRDIFESTGRFEITTARNGRDALDQVEASKPDVVTLDVNMPEMDGLSCLSEIMTRSPRPVVMVSSITSEGAQITLEALELGAVDYVEKLGGTVSLNIASVSRELLNKVEAAARSKPRRTKGLTRRIRMASEGPAGSRWAERRRPRPDRRFYRRSAHSGGLLPELSADFPWPVVVAQRMPSAFTGSFAARLNKICPVEVLEVNSPLPLKRGHVYIGRGNADVIVDNRLGRPIVNSVGEDGQFLRHPSVERLVRSAMQTLDPKAIVGVELTGMGNDGAEAMTALKRAGGRTIAEHESTAIVNGMPAELVRMGGARTYPGRTSFGFGTCSIERPASCLPTTSATS